MGRHPPVSHQAYHEAFIKLLQQRTGEQTQNYTQSNAIVLFNQMSKQLKSGFWQELSKNLGVKGDWVIKHFSNCYLKHVYQGDIKQYQDQIINYIAKIFNDEGQYINQNRVREDCRHMVEGKDIFPVAVDNLVYHVIKGLRNGTRLIQGNIICDDKNIDISNRMYKQTIQQTKPIVLKPLYSVNPPPIIFDILKSNDPVISKALSSLQSLQSIQYKNQDIQSLSNIFSANLDTGGGFW